MWKNLIRLIFLFHLCTYVCISRSIYMASTISVLNPSPIIPHHHNFKIQSNNYYNTIKSTANLSTSWREIQGSNNWKNLANPLNPLLQSEIIRYGELVSACYKVFDFDPNSSRHHNCKYGKRSMFKSIGMESSGYHVSRYVYATPDIAIPMRPSTCASRWIGYVAVSSDEEVERLGRRDLLVCFRGTVTSTEWIANMMSSLTPARLDPSDERNYVKVESGFLSLYTCDDSTCRFGHGSCREQLLSEISRMLNKYKGEEISITLAGHSMGSSLALLLGYDLAELGLNWVNGSIRDPIPITVYSFGGPRVGNLAFKKRCEELDVKVLRVVNVNDPITKMPGVLLNENFRILDGEHCYAHVGVELALDFFKMENPTWVHDLDAYINGLLNCNKLLMQRKRKRLDIVTRARDFVRKHKFDAARQVGDLVQSLGF